MPSHSEKQEKFFTIASKNPDFARQHGIKPEVAQEWHAADKAVHSGNHMAGVKVTHQHKKPTPGSHF